MFADYVSVIASEAWCQIGAGNDIKDSWAVPTEVWGGSDT